MTAAVSSVLCVAGRRRPGRWRIGANWALAVILLATSGLWLATTASQQHFSAATSLPFALCDMAALVAAVALATRNALLVELTYFWGLAGTLQALVTPDLGSSFPSLEFFEYVIGHGAIVCAALFLVVGQRLAPRPRAVLRVSLVTIAYSAFVGGLDAVTGGDYMYLRHPPATRTLLSVLGPWPWYIVSAAGVAIVLFTLLDLPWWRGRRASRASVQPAGFWGDATRRRSASIFPTGQTEARSEQTVGQGSGPTPPVQSAVSGAPNVSSLRHHRQPE